MCVQDYSEEFRDISGKGKRGGQIPEGAITLLNQRTVGDDLPVIDQSPLCSLMLNSPSGRLPHITLTFTLLQGFTIQPHYYCSLTFSDFLHFSLEYRGILSYHNTLTVF